jgi:hypothetical protein
MLAWNAHEVVAVFVIKPVVYIDVTFCVCVGEVYFDTELFSTS